MLQKENKGGVRFVKKMELVDWTEKQNLLLQSSDQWSLFLFPLARFLGARERSATGVREGDENQWMKEN